MRRVLLNPGYLCYRTLSLTRHRLFADSHAVFIQQLQLMGVFMSVPVTSIFVCPDPVKYVDFEVMNHIFCPAVPGSAACTNLAQNLMGGSCRRDEIVQETLGKERSGEKQEEGEGWLNWDR